MPGMQADGASTWGSPFWALTAFVVVLTALTLKSGVFHPLLRGGRTVERQQQPRLFWALVTLLVAVAATLASAAFWLDRHSFAYLGPGRTPPSAQTR